MAKIIKGINTLIILKIHLKYYASISAIYINLIKIYLAHTKLSLAFQQNDTNKTRLDSISYCVGWLKHKTLITPKVGKNVEQIKLSYVIDGSVKWYNHLGKVYVVSHIYICSMSQ